MQYGLEAEYMIPRNLRCGHTFCSSCLGLMIRRGIGCPGCCLSISVNDGQSLPFTDVSQIPVNQAILEVLAGIIDLDHTTSESSSDESAARSSTSTTPSYCGVCNQRNAQVVCVDCQPGVNVMFCHPCDQCEHNRPFKPVQGHRRYPIDRVPAPVFTCSRHRDKQTTLYSENLQEFACEECKRAPDWLTRSTMFVPIPDALNKFCSHSQKLNIYSLKVMSQLKHTECKMKRIIDGLDSSASKAKLEIQTNFGAIVDLIQTRQQQLLGYVENEVNTDNLITR